jgi:hypothetical protein
MFKSIPPPLSTSSVVNQQLCPILTFGPSVVEPLGITVKKAVKKVETYLKKEMGI